jgi:hypothetical protein
MTPWCPRLGRRNRDSLPEPGRDPQGERRVSGGNVHREILPRIRIAILPGQSHGIIFLQWGEDRFTKGV